MCAETKSNITRRRGRRRCESFGPLPVRHHRCFCGVEHEAGVANLNDTAMRTTTVAQCGSDEPLGVAARVITG